MRRPRSTVRRAMILVALVALACAVASEFRDGLPPRFVVRGIKGRIERLRPGMNHEEVDRILGLKTSWLMGGLGVSSHESGGTGHIRVESYYVRPPRATASTAVVGGKAKSTTFWESRALVVLIFDTPDGWIRYDKQQGRLVAADPRTMRLKSASASDDGRVFAEMPGGQ